MSPGDSPPPDEPQDFGSQQDLEEIHIPSLPLVTRMVLLGLSWICLILGLAGLLLPGLQGVLLLLLGMALMSVASDTVHGWMERALHRYPRLQERLQRFRDKIHKKFGRKT
ncbi:MAG: hypothetical protein WBO69_14065 [Thermoanaerobaculia bacterium]|jgi:uncharacterized membrane protein YbaN (DUF454 family)